MKLSQNSEYYEPELSIGKEYYEITDIPHELCYSNISGNWELYKIVEIKNNGIIIQNENGSREISPEHYIKNKRLLFIKQRPFGAGVIRLSVKESNDIRKELYKLQEIISKDRKYIELLQGENERLKNEKAELEIKNTQLNNTASSNAAARKLLSVDVNALTEMTDIEKANLIIRSSYSVNLLLCKKKQLIDLANNMRQKDEYDTIIALLYFLIGGLYMKGSNERRSYMRRAHEELVKSLTQTVKQQRKLSEAQQFIIPCCSYDSHKICAARKTSPKNNKPYIYCKTSTNCMNYNSTQVITEAHRERVASGAEHADLRDILFNVWFSLNDISIISTEDSIEDCEYPYRIAAYAQRLPDLIEYLKCSVCGNLLYPDMGEYQLSFIHSIVYFTCPTIGHDDKVYINHCYQCGIHYHTTKIIDSRECKHTESEIVGIKGKQKLCMRCGGSQNVPPKTICPNCLSRNIKKTDNDYIECMDCGHSGSSFGDRPQTVTSYNDLPW